MNDDEKEKEYEIPEPEPKDAVEQHEDKLLKEQQEKEQRKITLPTNFGYENRWVNAGRKPPALIANCRENQHKVEKTNVGNCLTKTYCPYCNYEYLTDSSG